MFVEALKKAHNRFVHNRAENCEQLVKKHLDNATSEFAFSVTQVSEEKIQARVREHLHSSIAVRSREAVSIPLILSA